MFVDDVVLRAAAPPAVRVPTLEPSTSSFATTRMLRSNVQHQRKQQQQQQPHRSTLRDHYQARQLGLAQQNPHHADPLEEMENTTNDVHIEELIRGIKETSAAATAAIEEITGGSPPPRPVTPSLQQTPPEQLHFRSASPERTNYVRSSSATRPRRDGSPARPAWNQNRPTPRVRPTVSAPRTEPRRVTREASADSRSRPWLEGVQRTNSLKGQLSGDNGVKTNSGSPISATKHIRTTPLSARQTPSARVTASPATASRRTTAAALPKDATALEPRLDFLEKSLQDTQQRAVRAEARCEELEVALQTLTLQHRETTSRLEERNAQLNAQVQYALQWIQQCDLKRLEKENDAHDTEAETGRLGARVVEAPLSLSTSDDVIGSTYNSASVNPVDMAPREVAVRATTVRVPPAPPMTLQLQHH